MILVQNLQRPLNGNNLSYCSMRVRLFFFTILFSVLVLGQTKPESFITHKVKKKETLYGLARQYKVSIEQINEFNPIIEKIGLKKKMELKIPVYPAIEVVKSVPLKEGLEKYLVQPKETKWRLAYRYGLTIQELETLNPQVVEGLKIGQEIVVPKRLPSETKALEEEFNYYKVKPKEGFYRIEKKLGVTQADLVALNPTLPETGLQVGMILKIPPQNTGDLKIENDLLVEKVRLEDSIFTNTSLQIAAFLPFKSSSIEFDSIEKTTDLLQKRNLHTLSVSFYMGMEMALLKADSLGIKTTLRVFDTQNNKDSLRSTLTKETWEGIDAVIGPLIPSNFNVVAQAEVFKEAYLIAPLSSKPVNPGPKVVQSVSSMERLRLKMSEFLTRHIDTTQNVVIIADTLNAEFALQLEKQYPFAHRVRPEEGGFIIPDLIDSLLIDSLPNKVIFESQDLNLAANVTSLLNSQVSKERDVQLFTTLRANIYDNENISRKHLGNIGFTYTTGTYPFTDKKRTNFKNSFQELYGDYPTKEAIRAYDVTLDVLLRLAYENSLYLPNLGETEYIENRFFYEKEEQGYLNTGYYLLQHQDYDLIEIKK